MKISIFTPTNDSKFLPLVYKSLLAQSEQDWEWIIVYNNGGEPLEFNDSRIKNVLLYKAPEWIGPLKAIACEQAEGDILLELDHDDLLMPTAIEEVKKAFTENPDIGFVYSNAIRINSDFSKPERFDSKYGWQYRELNKNNGLQKEVDETVSFEPTPEAISRIWFAPDHLRAFRKSLYEEIGGYNKEMRVLDDLDLMCRFYLKTEFYHIDKPLYIYRIHGENAWLKYNQEIQENVMRLYDKYIESLVEISTERQGLRKLDLGGRFGAKIAYEKVDLKDADIICDLNQKWPFEDNSVGVIRAFDIFEHLKNPIFTMQEVSRVLAPGGWLFCQIPSTDGRGAFQDPTHVSFWNENSFLYYTNQNWAKYIDTPVRFQATRLITTLKDERQVSWVQAHLINLKDSYRPPGLIEI